MKLRHLFDLHVDVDPPVSTGSGPYGRRVFYPLSGGKFEGAFEGTTLRGIVVPGGGDWVLIGDDVSHLDIRITLQTDDGFAIYLQAFGVLKVNEAVRRRIENPDLITEYGETYFMTQPRFETGDQVDASGSTKVNPYKGLNDLVVVGQGRLGPSFPGYMAARWLETKSFIVEN